MGRGPQVTLNAPATLTCRPFAQAILLMHFSARYKAADIEHILRQRLPPGLRERVAAATGALQPPATSKPRGLLFPEVAAKATDSGAGGARAQPSGHGRDPSAAGAGDGDETKAHEGGSRPEPENGAPASASGADDE